jgi:hypothetical protein
MPAEVWGLNPKVPFFSLAGRTTRMKGAVPLSFASFEGWGYEKDGDTLFPNFDNGTAIEVKIV